MTAVLLIGGTLILKATENITWMGAFFQSMTTRTAGFSTYNIGNFSKAGLFAMCILMFIGASPGSTGGGVKTTTIFVMIQALKYFKSIYDYCTICWNFMCCYIFDVCI